MDLYDWAGHIIMFLGGFGIAWLIRDEIDYHQTRDTKYPDGKDD